MFKELNASKAFFLFINIISYVNSLICLMVAQRDVFGNKVIIGITKQSHFSSFFVLHFFHFVISALFYYLLIQVNNMKVFFVMWENKRKDSFHQAFMHKNSPSFFVFWFFILWILHILSFFLYYYIQDKSFLLFYNVPEKERKKRKTYKISTNTYKKIRKVKNFDIKYTYTGFMMKNMPIS